MWRPRGLGTGNKVHVAELSWAALSAGLLHWFSLVSPLWSAEGGRVCSRVCSDRPGVESCPALLAGWPWATSFPWLSPSFFVCKMGDSNDKAITALAAIIKPWRRAKCFIHRSSLKSLAKQESFHFTNEKGCEILSTASGRVHVQ